MSLRSILILGTASLGFTAAAGAGTLTDSLSAWQAGATGVVTATPVTGIAVGTTVSALPLADGNVLGVSPAIDVAAPLSGWGALWANGYMGDVFPSSVPPIVLSAYTPTETITIAPGISALGFEVASALDAGDTITVTASNGQSISDFVPGVDPSTFVSPVQFFGFFGGGITSVTITSAHACSTTGGGLDCGFAFANLQSVPEPASLPILAGALGMALAIVRRRA